MILCGGSDSGEQKSPEHDFKYLYRTISKIFSANLFTCKGTYMTDWVGRIHFRHVLVLGRFLDDCHRDSQFLGARTCFIIMHYKYCVLVIWVLSQCVPRCPKKSGCLLLRQSKSSLSCRLPQSPGRGTGIGPMVFLPSFSLSQAPSKMGQN